jgi:hypothetical protein
VHVACLQLASVPLKLHPCTCLSPMQMRVTSGVSRPQTSSPLGPPISSGPIPVTNDQATLVGNPMYTLCVMTIQHAMQSMAQHMMHNIVLEGADPQAVKGLWLS